MAIFEVRLPTNVSGFEVEELESLNGIDSNFIPDWVFHLSSDLVPPDSDSSEFVCWYLDNASSIKILSNPSVLDLLLEDYL